MFLKNKKIKLVLRCDKTNKKLKTIKFSKQESRQIRQISSYLKLSEEQVFQKAFEIIKKQSY